MSLIIIDIKSIKYLHLFNKTNHLKFNKNLRFNVLNLRKYKFVCTYTHTHIYKEFYKTLHLIIITYILHYICNHKYTY